MSKKSTDTELDGSPVEASKENKQPTVYDDLLKNGTAILEAPTREELADLVNLIPADCKYMAGAVGRKADGSAYTLQVDIVKQ
jgi:hypothetical protein